MSTNTLSIYQLSTNLFVYILKVLTLYIYIYPNNNNTVSISQIKRIYDRVKRSYELTKEKPIQIILSTVEDWTNKPKVLLVI